MIGATTTTTTTTTTATRSVLPVQQQQKIMIQKQGAAMQSMLVQQQQQQQAGMITTTAIPAMNTATMITMASRQQIPPPAKVTTTTTTTRIPIQPHFHVISSQKQTAIQHTCPGKMTVTKTIEPCSCCCKTPISNNATAVAIATTGVNSHSASAQAVAHSSAQAVAHSSAQVAAHSVNNTTNNACSNQTCCSHMCESSGCCNCCFTTCCITTCCDKESCKFNNCSIKSCCDKNSCKNDCCNKGGCCDKSGCKSGCKNDCCDHPINSSKNLYAASSKNRSNDNSKKCDEICDHACCENMNKGAIVNITVKGGQVIRDEQRTGSVAGNQLPKSPNRKFSNQRNRGSDQTSRTESTSRSSRTDFSTARSSAWDVPDESELSTVTDRRSQRRQPSVSRKFGQQSGPLETVPVQPPIGRPVMSRPPMTPASIASSTARTSCSLSSHQTMMECMNNVEVFRTLALTVFYCDLEPSVVTSCSMDDDLFFIVRHSGIELHTETSRAKERRPAFNSTLLFPFSGQRSLRLLLTRAGTKEEYTCRTAKTNYTDELELQGLSVCGLLKVDLQNLLLGYMTGSLKSEEPDVPVYSRNGMYCNEPAGSCRPNKTAAHWQGDSVRTAEPPYFFADDEDDILIEKICLPLRTVSGDLAGTAVVSFHLLRDEFAAPCEMSAVTFKKSVAAAISARSKRSYGV